MGPTGSPNRSAPEARTVRALGLQRSIHEIHRRRPARSMNEAYWEIDTRRSRNLYRANLKWSVPRSFLTPGGVVPGHCNTGSVPEVSNIFQEKYFYLTLQNIKILQNTTLLHRCTFVGEFSMPGIPPGRRQREGPSAPSS